MWRKIYFIELYLLMLGTFALLAYTFFIGWNNWSTVDKIVWISVSIFVSLMFYVILKHARRIYDAEEIKTPPD